MGILQYESKIWATADLLRGCGIKESEWPSFMMPFLLWSWLKAAWCTCLISLKPRIFCWVIPNSGMHWKKNQDNVFPAASKLEHPIIHKLIAEIFNGLEDH